MLLWTEFLLLVAAIYFSGVRLSRYGDIIAEKSGLGRTWIGVVLLASITSLPELITGISSASIMDLPDIAAGNVIGACCFNLLTLSLLDTFHAQTPISARAHPGHVLSASIGIFMLATVAFSLLLGSGIEPIGWVGFYTPVIIISYFAAMKLIYAYEKRQIRLMLKEAAEEPMYREVSTRHAAAMFSVNAAVVIIAAVFLPGTGGRIAAETGLGQVFVGNVIVTFATTLPEIVVSVSAMKIGAPDLAVGNLLGSNIFNILILAVDDVFFAAGPILSFAGRQHIFPLLFAIAMTAVAVIGLTYRAEKKRIFLAWDSFLIALLYFINVLVLYSAR